MSAILRCSLRGSLFGLLACMLLASLFIPVAAHAADDIACEALRTTHSATLTVTAADFVAAGTLSGARDAALPAYCRVAVTLRPSADSDIHMELWLPAPAAWNGKYEGTGNGGWGGSIERREISAAVQRGYAASSSDTGHTGGSASFAPGHKEKLIDFGYRAIHEMALASKTLIAAYYGSSPKLSYFQGCSSGGRQALMEAQRFPSDYDGIIAGAPTNNWTRLMFARIWVAQAALSDPASFIPPAKYPMIHQSALAVCDALDGVRDGVIDDPRKCSFDPGVLECKAGDAADCLTHAQVAAARRIYAPTRNPRTGEEIFPSMKPGSELVWARLAGGPQPIQLADDHFKYVVFEDPSWDFRTLNFDSDVVKAMARDNGVLSANNPDLRPFFTRGGKLIEYQGWTDQQVMPENSIHYFESVHAASGALADSSYRLFMAPGMNHCGGGDGPNTFDMLTALEQWREHGNPPGAVVASHVTNGKVDRTRPLCPYPAVARYKGSGSTDEASNFACAKP